MAKVMIVMPTFNQGHLIKKTLDSLVKQTYTDWHLLVVNDCCTDDTYEIVKEYIENHVKLDIKDRRSIALFSLDRNRKTSAALNFGFATSDIIGAKYETWISSDNLYYPNFLQRLVDELDSWGHVGFVYSDYEILDKDGHRGKVITHKPYSKNRLENDYEQGMCFMWRKGLRVKAGTWFDERLQCQDYNMALRMSEFHEFKHIDETLGGYRVHDAQIGTDDLHKHSLEAKKLYFQWKEGMPEGEPQTYLEEDDNNETP